ncbi:endonuclease/exonuclease/phosphatase family protein [Selenomonas ruminantium]|nr:hypothetical protein [Selenomonas ruminantium]
MLFTKKTWLRAGMAAMMLTGAGLYTAPELPWQAGISYAAEQKASLHIGDIQGESHVSPYKGKTVKDIRGVITFRQSESVFFIQDEGDGNDKTADGIMVYAPNTSAGIGDYVSVDGEVTEFYGPGYKGKEETDLSITEIKASKVKQLGRKELPQPVVLDKDRKIPRKVIDSDGLTVFNPDKDAIDFWESLEGMLVEVEQPIILGPQRYGEIFVVPGTHEGPFNNSGSLSITAEDMHPEHICLSMVGGNAKSYVCKSGDRLNGNVTGVVSYGFGIFKVLTRTNQMPPLVDGGLQPEKTTINPDPAKLLVASYNIENFSANPSKTPDRKVKRLAESIVNDLKKPDIITVLELQDNDGPTDSGDADATKSAKRLTDAIKEISGVQYDCVNINPNNNEDGGQPGANIRVAYFYRPDRVQLKAGKIGKANDANKWVDGHLSLNPGRINPKDELYNFTRKSLAAEFTFNGKDVVIVANHLNSKRGDDTLYGQKQPVVLKSEAKRLKLAADIKKFVDEGFKQNPNLNIILTGDFNDFEFSPVIKTFEGANMTSVIKDYDLGDRYAYYYQGNNQILDNIIVSNNLKGHYEFDIVHVNSSFMEEHGRVSDHDPLLIQLDLQ